MKKIICAFLCALISLSVVLTSAGCGGERGLIKDGKTVNIKMVSAGYGSSWLREIADKFEKLYENKGYKINILEPVSGFLSSTALSEMRLGYGSMGVDLYLTAGVFPADVINDEYGVCAEDIDDVYDSSAINFDGTKSASAIKENIDEKLDRRVKVDGKYYDFYWYVSPTGLVANTTVLGAYGINELPRTTDEMFSAYNKIYYGANGKQGSSVSRVFPTTWAGDNAYGYSFFPLFTYLGQVLDEKTYDDLFEMDCLLNDNGTVKSDGYEMFDNPDIKEVLKVMIQQYDVMYSYPGSMTQRHDTAHAQVMRDVAAFMSDGEFFFNEVKKNFSDSLSEVSFLNFPVVSYVGQKLKLDGSGTNAELCDKILSFVVKEIDANKTVEQIKSSVSGEFGVTLTDTQIDEVTRIRRTVYLKPEGDAYIAKDTPVADIAKLFLRMLASEDAAKVMSKYAMGSAYAQADILQSDYPFIKNAKNIFNTRKRHVTNLPYADSVRGRTQMFVLPKFSGTFCVDINAEIGIVSDPKNRDYDALARKYYDDIRKDAKDNWAKYMERGGYTLG